MGEKTKLHIRSAPPWFSKAILIAVLWMCFGIPESFAEEGQEKPAPEVHEVEKTDLMRVGLRAGVSAFLHAQSYRPAHFIKPTTRVEFGHRVAPSREIGIELAGTQSENTNYKLLGFLAFARGALYESSTKELWFRGGFGMGTGPRILFKDLSYEKALIPWGQLSLDMRWRLMPGMHLGTAIAYENLSVINLLLSLDFKV